MVRALAAKDYQAEAAFELPDFLKNLNYDGYQQIRYRPEQGPWYTDALRFTLQFFHPGYIYREPVLIHLAEDGQVHEFPFSPQQFAYGTNQFPKPLPGNLHFAGLHVFAG
jgi:glucans biosynthesis protein